MDYSQNTVMRLLEEKKNPLDPQMIRDIGERVYAEYGRRIREARDELSPESTIFHNGGHIPRGRRDLIDFNSHIEIESLPTGGWGYDHFPVSARYASRLGKEFLGMTGKFHTTWGEFGGFKHPNALRYETALCLAHGAKISVGDQMHPAGFLDPVTYELIGSAYREVEEKEAWCEGVEPVADIAILSHEAVQTHLNEGQSPKNNPYDTGAARMFLEAQLLFDVIDTEEQFGRYKVVVLPDAVRLDDTLKQKLELFVEGGGRILATGESGLAVGADAFALNFGVRWVSKSRFRPDYLRPRFERAGLSPQSSYVMYGEGELVELLDGEALADREEPYFNREVFHFCSHQHTPSARKVASPAVVSGPAGVYIGWKVFRDYVEKGSYLTRELVLHALETLLPEPSLRCSLPSKGIATLMNQGSEQRLVAHLLYASPILRGSDPNPGGGGAARLVQVIEDIVPLSEVELEVKTERAVKRVYLAPEGDELEMRRNGAYTAVTVPRLDCHQMVVFDYG
jgi:hypothetical protein